MKLLFLYTNPKGITRYAAKKYIDKHFANHELTECDLSQELNDQYLSMDNIGAYYQDSKKWVDHILDHDVIVIATSMYNYFPNPTSLNFLNKISVQGMTFTYNKEGKLVKLKEEEFKNKKLIVVASSGSNRNAYPKSLKNIFEGYAEAFSFIGLNQAKLVLLDGTNEPENYGKSFEQICEHFSEQLK